MNDQNVLEALRAVKDPELGINIVHLGLIYRAEHTAAGIEVDLTLTAPSCPLSEMLLEEAREVLKTQFADVPSISVELTWDPPWTPDRMNEQARRQLGW